MVAISGLVALGVFTLGVGIWTIIDQQYTINKLRAELRAKGK